jgi:ribosome silencing factor RsfS/YbeB/iojap
LTPKPPAPTKTPARRPQPAAAKSAAPKPARSAKTPTTAKRKPATKAAAKAATRTPRPTKPEAAAAAPRKTAAKAQKYATETANLRKQVLTAMDDLKAKDVKEIDVRGRASFADLLVIASGTSTRHVKSIADEVVRFSKRAGVMPLGVEGEREAEWVLVDLGDIVVHVMLPRIREFYSLERLWSVGGDADTEAALPA